MKILIGYDGSKSADAAIAMAGKLLAGSEVEAIVLSVWEPLSVAAVRAARFGAPMSAIASDASDVDDRSERRHGSWPSAGPSSPELWLRRHSGVGGERPRRDARNRRRGERTRRRPRRGRSARSCRRPCIPGKRF